MSPMLKRGGNICTKRTVIGFHSSNEVSRSWGEGLGSACISLPQAVSAGGSCLCHRQKKKGKFCRGVNKASPVAIG